MKDIFTILAENKVTVPDEVKETITTAVNENYKTVAEVNKITASRELNPSAILVYGRGIEYQNYFRNVYFYESYCQKLKKRL